MTSDKLVLDVNLERIRTTPVNIGGINCKLLFLIESKIKEEVEELINQKNYQHL